ncbi:2-hydroxyisoflavanone dehydratase-like [Quercus robur]|uniref:2-hydroxyisoflavanone dehydratase-like n=1 Tax=Quercus robur TaxID=38942 RepID=UPI002161E6B5|nr:2-hydroxyisoflavanone dehydratase-like [Quercus robur]
MHSSNNETTHEFPPYFKVYKDGRVERYMAPDTGGNHLAPAGLDSKTGVQTKDVVVLPESGVSARLFIPKINSPDQKFPLVVHDHGGGFCLGSPFMKPFHNFLVSLASEANVVVISVDYRLAPEHALLVAHEDSWAAMQWISTHSNGQGLEPWLNQYADFGIGFKDLLLYSEADPNLSKMAGKKVLVCVAEKDRLKDRGLGYCETLRKSGWNGSVGYFESEGEGHGFFLLNPSSDKVEPLIKAMVDFINQN